MPSHQTTWMSIADFASQFSSYALEGKLNDRGGGGGGIDKPDRCYIRRRKREKEGNKQTEAELEV